MHTNIMRTTRVYGSSKDLEVASEKKSNKSVAQEAKQQPGRAMGTCANSGLFSAEADNILPGKISATTIELLTRAMMMVMTQMMR